MYRNRKERNTPDTNRVTDKHNPSYMYSQDNKLQRWLRARLRQIGLQQLSATKQPIGELSGSSRRAGSCTGDRAEAKPPKLSRHGRGAKNPQEEGQAKNITKTLDKDSRRSNPRRSNPNPRPKWYTLTTQNGQPLSQGTPPSFYSPRRGGRYNVG